MKSFVYQLTYLGIFTCWNLLMISTTFAQSHSSNKQMIPIGGNSWVNKEAQITKQGLVGWTNPQTVCTTYLRVTQGGNLKLSLFINAQNSNSKIKISILNKSLELQVGGGVEKEYFAGVNGLSPKSAM